jgi:predicted TIM-barrel fold metal-dependent hydrolase
VPAGACDCHTHIFGGPARFPVWSGRTYTPPQSSVDDWESIHRTFGIGRGVIVQPSVYGTDNRCALDAIEHLGGRARGLVAVIGDMATDADLDALHKKGIRGIRLNLETFGIGDPAAASDGLRRALAGLAHRPWHVQLFVRSLSCVKSNPPCAIRNLRSCSLIPAAPAPSQFSTIPAFRHSCDWCDPAKRT